MFYCIWLSAANITTCVKKLNLQWDESLDVGCPEMRMCIGIARNCTDADRDKRPTIHQVIHELGNPESMIPRSSKKQVQMINSSQSCSPWWRVRSHKFHHTTLHNPASIFFFARKFPIYSSSIMAVQRIQEIIKITSRSIDHLATTTNTEASQRCAVVIAPPSPEPGKPCCSK